MKESTIANNWFREGVQEGESIGIVKGELIGQIRLLQKLLHEPITEKADLEKRDRSQLQELLNDLERRYDPHRNGSANGMQ